MWFLVDLFVMTFWTVVNIVGLTILYFSVHFFRAENTNFMGKVLCFGLAFIVISGYLFALGIYLREHRRLPKRPL